MPGKVSTSSAAAAEAARRAAEEAARRAREEAARKAAAEAAAKAKATARTVAPQDELSTGVGSALRTRALAVTGATGAASSLATEVRGDAVANCLERAANEAQPGDSVVLLEDERDPVGHAVVQRADGSVTDPNSPDTEYASLEVYQAENPHYSNPVSVSDGDVERILGTPPGAQRRALIENLGLEAVASRRVADAGEVSPEVRATVDSVIAPNATPAQREEAYAQVQGYVDEVGGVGDAGVTQQALYERANEVLTAEGIPTAATAEVQQWTDLVLADDATPAQRQQAYVEAQALVTGAGGLHAISEPGQIPVRMATLLQEKGIPGIDPRVVSAVDGELMERATLTARRDGYVQLQDYVDEAGGIGDSGVAAEALPAQAHELITGESIEEYAPAAADRVAQLADSGASPDEVRAALAEEVARYPGDAAYQQALATELAKRMDAYNPINERCDDIEARNEALGDAIVFVTEQGGRDLAVSFARGFASVADDQAYSRPAGVVMGDYFASALEGPMAEQGAIRFGLALTEELARTNNLQSAGRVDQVLTYAMYAVQERFNDLNGDIEGLHEDLGAALGPVGGAMTPEQQQLAVEEFQRRNEGKFDQWEAAGAQYAQMMEALGETDRSQWTHEMTARAEGFVQDLPTLARTQAGTEFLAEEIEKQGLEQPSFMGFVSELGEQGKLTKELSENLSVAITRSVGMRALAYAQAGQAGGATALLDGLRRNANLFGVTGRTMDDVVNALGTLRPGMSQADLEAFTTRYNQSLDNVLATGINPTGGAMQAFRALGVAVGAAYCLDGFANEEDLALKTQYLSDALGMGADAGMTVVEAMNASGRFAAGRGASFVNAAGNVFRITGALTGGLSAIVDGISAARAFSEGKPLEGAASAQMAVGGLLMSAAALQVIPGWGQLAGAGLLFTGLVTSVIAGRREDDRIRDLRRDLMQAAGLPDGVAQALRDANYDRMKELTEDMGLSVEQIQEIATKWPWMITQGEGNGISMQGVRALQTATGMTNDQVMELFRAVGTGEEAERSMLMLLGNTSRAMGDTQTPQGWLDIANGYLESSSDEEHTRVWTIIRDTLLEQQRNAGES